MAVKSEQRFTRIVDDLYAGTLDDAAWKRAIAGVAECVLASGAFLLAFNPQTRQLLRFENHGLDPRIPIDYQRYWTYQDIRREHFLDLPVGIPVTERMLPLDGAWKRSSILNEFLIPADVPHFMPAWLHKSPDKVVALSYQATRKRGPFEPADLEFYQRILPHIRRALQIRDRLEGANVRAGTLADQLDTVNFGIAILDHTGRLLEANAIVRGLLGPDNGMRRLPDGTLILRDPAGAQLARCISTGMPPASSRDGLLRVPRSARLPLSILVTPLPERPPSWAGVDPRWLIMVFDPERRLRVSAPMLATHLGVSARESEVAARLAAGCTLKEAAQQLAISQHTARAQLKSIFRRTGLRSQVELMHRMAIGPTMKSKLELRR